jgi:hypothetical protein
VLSRAEFGKFMYEVDIYRASYSSKLEALPSTVNSDTVRKKLINGSARWLNIHRYGVPRNILSEFLIKDLDSGTESSMNGIEDHPPCASLYLGSMLGS